MARSVRRTITDLLHAWNAHDIEKIAAFYAANYIGIDVGQAKTQQGREGITRSVTAFLRAFPDVYFTGEVVVEGKRGVLIWLMRGTHTGTLMRIPPTNKVVEFRGVSVLTVENTQIIHGLYVWDVAGFLRAVGLLPELQ